MRWGVAAAVVGILSAPTAEAGAVITLDPQNDGPYAGGETFTVDVYVTADQSFVLRFLGFDFSNTSPGFGLSSTFDFDCAAEIGCFLYTQFPTLPLPQMVFSTTQPIPGFIIALEAGVPYHAGSFELTMPLVPGQYLLDVMNLPGSESNPNLGARLDFGFDQRQTWTPANGQLTGGQWFIPEPATLVLLAVGGVAVASSRRRGAK